MVVGGAMIVIACFPFVFSQILPLLTYAGLLVVPVGAIVFAEHQIFPRIGYTRYWSKFQDYAHSFPAIASWGLGLVFGFGLNFLDVMSFYYLFLPTWVFTILTYTVLAGRYGAKQKYPEAEKKEKVYNQSLDQYLQKIAMEEAMPVQDTSLFSKVLQWLSYVALLVTFALALRVLLASPNEILYTSHREHFYQIGFVCTLIYFVAAYWSMNRNKSAKLNP